MIRIRPGDQRGRSRLGWLDSFHWLRVVSGVVSLNGQVLRAGDGPAASDETRLEIRGVDPAELLPCDLA